MLRMVTTIMMIISIVMFAVMADNHKDKSKSEKNHTCSTCKTHAMETQTKEMLKVMLTKVTFEKLMDGTIVNADLSNSKNVIIFLNKETVRDYNQISNFEKWLMQKNLDIKVHTVINGENKSETKKWAKDNNIMQALWDVANLSKQLKVENYPVAYYVVNGQIVDQTNKIDVGHLKQLVYCEKCKEVKTMKGDCCKQTGEHSSKKEEVKNDKKEEV
ncbi:MAG: hypothetical protein ACK4GR_02320, partial [bacterium]